ncbi:hypothetical protein SE17_10110 [Kouleothrix aurantiaca]|jgi:CheY-like chemotaxis protein|uniref:Response regulatory domain-containing protein n=1 Tax=Kouleothrix aurantiaca TaxID=186479 RepID=A0A0P9DIU3_9CHLR|nr:hypothetical protein SE17_10110 [Kouleothrix aurantiaca]
MSSILLVEDDPMQRDLISRILQRSGYEVWLAFDGMEAVSLASAHYPDIILMDALLPIMNGLDATRQLKKQPNTMHIPVIMLTAYVLIDALVAKTYGCDDFELKPINFSTLLAKIVRLSRPTMATELSA